MKMQRIMNAIAHPFQFRCCGCGKTFSTEKNAGCAVDVHGPMFDAYYCGECAKATALAHGVEIEYHPLEGVRRFNHDDP